MLLLLLLLVVALSRRTGGGDLDRRQHRYAAPPACSRACLAAAASAEGEGTPSTAGRPWWRSRRLSKRSSSPPRGHDREGAGESYARLWGCPSHQSTCHPPRGDYHRGRCSSACACHFLSSATRSGSRSRGRGCEPVHYTSAGFVGGKEASVDAS